MCMGTWSAGAPFVLKRAATMFPNSVLLCQSDVARGSSMHFKHGLDSVFKRLGIFPWLVIFNDMALVVEEELGEVPGNHSGLFFLLAPQT